MSKLKKSKFSFLRFYISKYDLFAIRKRLKYLIKAISIIIVLLLLFLSSLVAFSCYRNYSEQAKSLKKGERDEKGRFVIYTWGLKQELDFFLFKLDPWDDSYSTLDYQFGMMIFYNYPQPKDQIRFEIFEQESGKIHVANDLKKFKEILSLLPKGITIYLYNTCLGGTYYKADSDILEKMKMQIRNAGLFLENAELIICTCRG